METHISIASKPVASDPEVDIESMFIPEWTS